MSNEEILKKLSDAVVGGKVNDSKAAAQEPGILLMAQTNRRCSDLGMTSSHYLTEG